MANAEGWDVPDDEVTVQDEKITSLLRQLLGEVPGLRAREQMIVRAETKGAGSLAELDDRHKFGRFIWELSAQALGVAGDHLEAWRPNWTIATSSGASFGSFRRRRWESAAIISRPGADSSTTRTRNRVSLM